MTVEQLQTAVLVFLGIVALFVCAYGYSESKK